MEGVLTEGLYLPGMGPVGQPANTFFPDEGRIPKWGDVPGDSSYYGGAAAGQAVILVFAGPPPPPPVSHNVQNLGTGLAHDPSVNNIPPFPSVAPKSSVNQAVPILALNPMQPNRMLIGPSSHGGGPSTFEKFLDAVGQDLPLLVQRYSNQLGTEQSLLASPEWGIDAVLSVPDLSPGTAPENYPDEGDNRFEIPAPNVGVPPLQNQQFTAPWDFY